MPCDTIQTTNVEFTMQNTNVDILKAALENLGYCVFKNGNDLSFTAPTGNYVRATGTFIKGQFLLSSRSYSWSNEAFDINEVKRAYSNEVVKQTAKRFGWNIVEKKGTANVVYEARKRR